MDHSESDSESDWEAVQINELNHIDQDDEILPISKDFMNELLTLPEYEKQSYLEIEIEPISLNRPSSSLANKTDRNNSIDGSTSSSSLHNKNETKAIKARRTRIRTWLMNQLYKIDLLIYTTLIRKYNLICNWSLLKALMISLLPRTLFNLLEQNSLILFLKGLISWWQIQLTSDSFLVHQIKSSLLNYSGKSEFIKNTLSQEDLFFTIVILIFKYLHIHPIIRIYTN